LRAACDLSIAEVREYAGLHEYDGVTQDLSPAGVAAGLIRLGSGPSEQDRHDEGHLAASEAGLRVWFGEAEDHRRNPLVHLANLDLACYDREYAPVEERRAARQAHLARWPDAIEGALESLDRVPASVAASLLRAARGLAAGAAGGGAAGSSVLNAGLAAHARLVAHLERAAKDGPPEVALGGGLLARLMGEPEAMAVDLGVLSVRADAESRRLVGLLDDACARLHPGAPTAQVVTELLSEIPAVEDIYSQARAQIAEITAFTIDANLLADPGGECQVGPAPASRRWAMAMMSWSAPHEADAPSWYYVNPPDPAWTPEEQHDWLSVFCPTTLPAITAHEVTPGHYAHGRMLRQLRSPVRRTLFSSAFVEGWAHYTEELLVEEGFRSTDPRFAIGVYLEALVRVTRLAVAIGLHTESMDQREAVQLFEQRAYLRGPASRAEAERAAYDPTYGRYTWGKLEIRALRDEAVARWGLRYSHRRFHDTLLLLGAPPLGLMGDAFGD
jgi:hypothetical protein